jgi:uncharacterized protein (UPF0248 family)
MLLCEENSTMRPREVLNMLKWDPRFKFERAKVTILHRGAPGDVRVVCGDEILNLGRGFMRVASPEGGEVDIPYHRILKIEINGKVVWKKI